MLQDSEKKPEKVTKIDFALKKTIPYNMKRKDKSV